MSTLHWDHLDFKSAMNAFVIAGWNRPALAVAILLACGLGIHSSADVPGPFLGAYVHMQHCFDAGAEISVRERSIAASLDQFKDAGLQVVMPYATTTSGSALYASERMPRVFEDWDPLQVFVREARRRDLLVYPVVCVLACGHESPKGVLLEHPEWALRSDNGEPLGYISAGHPDARKWVVSTLSELVQHTRPDGILLDYLRFPNRPVQMDPDSAARFERRIDNLEGKVDRKGQYQLFREESLTKLAEQISGELRAQQPEISIAIYSWGPHVTKNHKVSQNWRLWIERDYIDMINISGYCYTDNYAARYMDVFRQRLAGARDIVRDAGGDVQLTFALGVKTSHGHVKSSKEIDDYLQAARQQGYDGTAFFTWSYLVPYLDDLARTGAIRDFKSAESK